MATRFRVLALLASAAMFGSVYRTTPSSAQPGNATAAAPQQQAVDGGPPAPPDADNQPDNESPTADEDASPSSPGSGDSDAPDGEARNEVPDEQSPSDTAPDSKAATDSAAGADAPETPESDATQPGDESGATQEATTEDDAATATSGLNPWLLLAIVIALFIVPTWFGNFCARKLRMPDHGWRISLATGTIAAAAVVIAMGWPPRGGPDLVGGITLIYEVEDRARLEQGPGQDGSTFNVPSDHRVDMSELIGALTERINPAGTKEVTLREYGAGQVEIIVPKAGADELEQLKNTITNLGELEFRIVASQTDPEHSRIGAEAEKLTGDKKDVIVDQKVVARWVPYDVNEFGPVNEPDEVGERAMFKRNGTDNRGGEVAETLILLDDQNVTGEYLDTTWASRDEAGRPAVSFRFDATGSRKFGTLTGRNVPNPATGRHKFLGILLNNELRSAPSINSKISQQGIIEGNFTEQEVESLVNVLNAGSLPAALNPTPLSEQVISPTIGLATVYQGSIAIVASLILVLIFMVIYYRFAGLVACMALLSNLVLILGTMMLLKADFTLPGLAGLVLTIGMSVDANVLIFERIREEVTRGAALRMAIRNGFDKAKSAIYDANITTILTGIVLFWIGTDQIKGFATTLIIGIVMSVYTAVFCSRIVFDVAEKRGWIKSLNMMQLVGGTNFDFLKMQVPAITVSCVLIAIGLTAVVQRGRDMLNIDFTGGVSASMVLREDAPLEQGEVRDALEKTELGDRNLLVVEQTELDPTAAVQHKKYMIYARVNDEEINETKPDGTPVTAVDFVQRVLEQTFADKLQTYSVAIRDVRPIEDPNDVLAGGTEATIVFGTTDEPQPVAQATVDDRLRQILNEAYPNREVSLTVRNPRFAEGSAERFDRWMVRLALPPDEARAVLNQFKSELDASPLFPLANRIGGKVAGDMQKLAALAIFFSLLCIIGYIWLRFQQVSFGVAAVIALVHDVLVTVGMLALSAWLVNYVSPVASAFLLEPFQISLQVVAALLTIIGYSLNDTIVIFDRIREVRGKSPELTREMINTSINQTLSRTLLTSLTTFIVVAILYFFGGAGIHGFAFSLVVGVIAGTYSTIFIASPALLWMIRPSKA